MRRGGGEAQYGKILAVCHECEPPFACTATLASRGHAGSMESGDGHGDADASNVGWIGSVSSHRTKAADSCRHPSAVCLHPPGYCSEGEQAATIQGWGQTG